ncbi:MAG TPA: SDR family NAD(P)-dependent oxidoreductase [Jatrophihabitantaceae bacterium]|nr:SDR family NAD(P)-dependent oxidoreductase [Jatrophihabitantaceae bacterium]
MTGAGRGMGAVHARSLAARGASVIVNDLPDPAGGLNPADEVVAGIVATGGSAIANLDSVASEAGAQAMVAAALDAFGRIDIVVNNAGIVDPKPFLDETLAGFMRHLSVHLGGAFNVTKAAWPHMMAQDFGRVVMITSSAIFGIADNLSYSAAKAGQLGLMRSLVVVAGDHDITINAVAPLAPSGRNATYTSNKPSAEQVSPVVLYLAHDACAVSGEVFGTGGGRTDRIFLGATGGWVDEGLTPESMSAHLDCITGEGGYWLPSSCQEHAEQLWAGGAAHLVFHAPDPTEQSSSAATEQRCS